MRLALPICDLVGKRGEPRGGIAPERHAPTCCNSPDPPVPRGIGGIAGRWTGKAVGMRMIIAEQLGLLVRSRFAMGRDQGRRIDFEMVCRVCRDVGGGSGLDNSFA